ncbi:MAG: prolipoprotein diacylglyceryl transferase [Candidatus Magnetoovum sp. WYHC-5]|nr:prolipoprotein diacylglyceryl transferase [Candidatus Magnetoovum sp. WYHC-5]
MIDFPHIKPYLLKIGIVEIRWYGLMYLLGFISSFILVHYQIRKKKLKIESQFVEEFYFYIIVGLVVGARVGYVLFYNIEYYIQNPLEIIAVWHGGMSFHGGLIGTILSGMYIANKRSVKFLLIADRVIITAPIGLGLGRIGNFINGELYGRVTSLPWGMVFPGTDGQPRHPSQLYEAFLEGPVLFIILWILKERFKTNGEGISYFLIFYGTIRFTIEFFRQPDVQVGFIFHFLTMGQILSAFMIAVGIGMFKYIKPPKRHKR